MEQFIEHIQTSIADVLGSWMYLLPEISLTIFFLTAIFGDLFFSKKIKNIVPIITLSGLAVALIEVIDQFLLVHSEPVMLFSQMLRLDHTAIWYKLLILFSGIIVVLFSLRDFKLRNTEKGSSEYFSLVLVVTIGLNFMIMAQNLLMIYLSVEFVSVCSYVLAASLTGHKRSEESGMKYALFGAVGSAVMLYGMSLLYGFTGTLSLLDPAFYVGLSSMNFMVAAIALLLTIAGLFFKISAFPMHVWVPDVYEGAPTPITTFLSVGPKAAGIALLINFVLALNNTGNNTGSVFLYSTEVFMAIVAIVTMCIGNFSALWQNNVKRLMAYSAIGQSGFILMGIAAYSLTGQKAILYFLFVYAFANIGAFLVIGYFSNVFHSEELDDYKGMGMKYPVVAACMVVFMVSLTGLPPTAGFVGKFLILSSAVEAYTIGGNVLLLIMVIFGVINTVVSLFYYLKIPLNLYLRKPKTEIALDKGNILYSVIIVFLAIITIILGIFPHKLMELMNL
ncbi:NADH-quinone oxidoreductase subunit N [Solitalea canadensis]|uniref:NADH-quinone oxidoreductase subunit N n=1 Tax=Solitalea canadensis (strain ATCC 29591 / DSM 3403 / JCM 21819 / LMG 8368 / NBRC 15130 / NCIMB 12057 / USAM 9D) TaxID=929556 RepID=H8KY14_SOLCM|nr:NADH-quinone oxidoreductase subunit N [Solitalea canadensis]AFD05752.1 proton-translocating NADH-quinone oxidoreductase, chain N [Solitalea canadensis DSM 3403]